MIMAGGINNPDCVLAEPKVVDQAPDLSFDLLGELSCRHKDQRARASQFAPVSPLKDLLYDWNGVCERFA